MQGLLIILSDQQVNNHVGVIVFVVKLWLLLLLITMQGSVQYSFRPAREQSDAIFFWEPGAPAIMRPVLLYIKHDEEANAKSSTNTAIPTPAILNMRRMYYLHTSWIPWLFRHSQYFFGLYFSVVWVPFFLSPEVVVQYLTRWDQCLRSAWGAAIAKIAQLLFSSQCCQGSLKRVLGKSLKIFLRI